MRTWATKLRVWRHCEKKDKSRSECGVEESGAKSKKKGKRTSEAARTGYLQISLAFLVSPRRAFE